MAILNISRDYGSNPSIVRMVTDDSYATMTAAGYLTAQQANIEALNVGAFEWRANDVILASYTGDATTLFTVSADFTALADFENRSFGALTAVWAGGGTSNAFAAAGLAATDIVVAGITASQNSVAVTKVVPTTDVLTVTFSADPGTGTRLYWIALRG